MNLLGLIFILYCNYMPFEGGIPYIGPYTAPKSNAEERIGFTTFLQLPFTLARIVATSNPPRHPKITAASPTINPFATRNPFYGS